MRFYTPPLDAIERRMLLGIAWDVACMLFHWFFPSFRFGLCWRF